MFVVTVEFEIRPDEMETFLPLMRENARMSLEIEPGCHQFDVDLSLEEANLVFLYEVYASEADFKEHLRMAHFLEFNAATTSMVLSKTVRTFQRVAQ